MSSLDRALFATLRRSATGSVVALGSACLAVFAACTKPLPLIHSDVPEPTAPEAGVATAPSAPPTISPTARSWTDRDAVNALAANCSPPVPDSAKKALKCDATPYQSCAPGDDCANEKVNCLTHCGSECRECDKRCGSTCDECRARCSDGACLTRCAERVAACKQSCLSEGDRCLTGGCSRPAKLCEANRLTAWHKGNCEAGCNGFKTCVDKRCSGNPFADRDDNDPTAPPGLNACAKKCKAAAFPRCDDKMSLTCFMMGPLDANEKMQRETERELETRGAASASTANLGTPAPPPDASALPAMTAPSPSATAPPLPPAPKTNRPK